MSKRVHEIAKERGLPAKEVLEKLRAAGHQRQGGLLERRRGRRGQGAGQRSAPRRRQRGARGCSAQVRRRQGARRQARDGKGGPGRAPTALVRPRRGAAPARQTQAQAAPQPEAKAARPSDAKPNAPADGDAADARRRRADGGAGRRPARRRRRPAQAPDPRLAAGRARARHRRRSPARGDRFPGFPPRSRRRSAPGVKPAAAPPAPRPAPPRRLRRRGRVASVRRPRSPSPTSVRINSGLDGQGRGGVPRRLRPRRSSRS